MAIVRQGKLTPFCCIWLMLGPQAAGLTARQAGSRPVAPIPRVRFGQPEPVGAKLLRVPILGAAGRIGFLIPLQRIDGHGRALATPGLKAQFVTSLTHPNKFSGDHAPAEFGTRHPNAQIIVAAAFTADWKIPEGVIKEDGRLRQGTRDQLSRSKFGAVVLMSPDGVLRIVPHERVNDESFRRATGCFEQFLILRGGRIAQDIRVPKGTGPWRFLVERRLTPGTEVGLLQIDAAMPFDEARKILQGMSLGDSRLETAAYLDMGAVAQGLTRDRKGRLVALVNRPTRARGYTNFLVFR